MITSNAIRLSGRRLRSVSAGDLARYRHRSSGPAHRGVAHLEDVHASSVRPGSRRFHSRLSLRRGLRCGACCATFACGRRGRKWASRCGCSNRSYGSAVAFRAPCSSRARLRAGGASTLPAGIPGVGGVRQRWRCAFRGAGDFRAPIRRLGDGSREHRRRATAVATVLMAIVIAVYATWPGHNERQALTLGERWHNVVTKGA